MRVVRFGAIATMLLLAASSVDASVARRQAHGAGRQAMAINDATVQRRWTRGDTAREDTRLGAMHMYFDLEADAAATAAAARCSTELTDLEARVECKKAALSPSVAERDALQSWLAPLGPMISHDEFLSGTVDGCSLQFNAVHCRGATVAAAKQVFGQHLRFHKYTQRRSGLTHPESIVMTEDAIEVAPAGRRISFVSGLQPYDHVEASAKHMGRWLSKDQTRGALREENKPVEGAAMQPPPTPTPSPYSQPWLSFLPVAWNAVGTLSGTAPYVVHTDYNYAYLIVMCSSGSPATSSGNSISCGSDATPSLYINVYEVGGSSSPVGSFPFDGTQCRDGGLYSPFANFGICRIAISSIFASSKDFMKYSIEAVASFADGTSATGGGASFFDGTMYVDGATDIGGSTLSANPKKPAITYPGAVLAPSSYFKAYNVPTSQYAYGQVQGVVEFSDPQEPAGGFHPSDLEEYLQLVGQSPSAATTNMSMIGNYSIVSMGETTLDIELVMGTARGAKSYIYCISYGTSTANYASYPDALAGFASSIMGSVGEFGTASVWSVSYGGPEWTTMPSLMTHINSLFGQASDAGVMVSASSGDSGVYFYVGSHDSAPEVIWSPNWPATSPHIVGVGATAALNQNHVPTLVTCNVRDFNIITSGGGYSQVFSKPAYQDGFVSGSMLGMPDVAMLGAWIATVLQGQLTPLFGTSASSPIFASMITMINANRAAAGKGALRNVPSLMYSSYNATSGAAFTDVTIGDNCAGEPVQPGLSGNFPSFAQSKCYEAVEGWDAVTGLGSLNFAQINEQGMARD